MKVKLREVCLKNKGWSVYDLSTLLAKHEGIAVCTTYAWSSGKRLPRAKHLDMLCNLLDCTLADLYEVEPYEFKSTALQSEAEKGRR